MGSRTRPSSLGGSAVYELLHRINQRPEVFERYTAPELWTDQHTSSKMLQYHLDESVGVASRRHEFIDRSAAWIRDEFLLDPTRSVLDLGCGPGLYANRFATTGAGVVGVDFSAPSLDYARKSAEDANLSVEYVKANYLDFATDRRFDLATIIMCDFCALSPAQRSQLLDRCATHLKRGGALLLDVYSYSAFDERTELATYALNLLDGFWSAKPYYGFLNTFKYDDAKVVLDKYTIVEETRVHEIFNWLQHFDPKSLRDELKAHGFDVRTQLGDVAGGSYDPDAKEFAVVALRS